MSIFSLKKKLISGFTLIELLVVVAIIGILASVVLASLNNARAKGIDAAIKANLKTIQNQAEIYYSDNGNYSPYSQTWCSAGYVGTMFNDDPIINKAISKLISLSGAPDSSLTRCSVCAVGNCTPDTEQFYAVAIQLKTGGTAGDSIPDAWCIDNSGNSKSFTYAIGQNIANAINFSTHTCN